MVVYSITLPVLTIAGFGLQLRVRNLETERRAWAGVIQMDDENAVGSPEAVAKKLHDYRHENDSLLHRIELMLAEKQTMREEYEAENAKLKRELKKSRAHADKAQPSSSSSSSSSSSDSRAMHRIEKQRVLALKEVDYLRAQLKALDDEGSDLDTAEDVSGDGKTQHIADLEALLDEHREEIRKCHLELSKQSMERHDRANVTENIGEDEPLRQPTLETQTLRDDLAKSEASLSRLQRELATAHEKLDELRQHQPQTRILELRANPTAEYAKIKHTTLTTLQAENRDLVRELTGKNKGDVKVVPVSTLEAMKLELEAMERTVEEKEKRMRRLKEIWTAKSSEFREAVASLLGYKLDFLPNGRVRVTSMFHLSPEYRHGSADASLDGPGSMGAGGDNSIIFDGENGTMKISGGPSSMFAMEIKGLIEFWVEGKKDIPCFLAAMTLDFFEKTTRATRM